MKTLRTEVFADLGIAIRHLSGTMDEFALWDRVLSKAEIKTMAR